MSKFSEKHKVDGNMKRKYFYDIVSLWMVKNKNWRIMIDEE